MLKVETKRGTATLHVRLDDHSRFHIRGPNWTARLGFWDRIPKGHLLLDAELIEHETSKATTVQLFVVKDGAGLSSYGGWQSANYTPIFEASDARLK
jgi:hypothetical protein